jgi:chromosome segregation ATPase
MYRLEHGQLFTSMGFSTTKSITKTNGKPMVVEVINRHGFDDSTGDPVDAFECALAHAIDTEPRNVQSLMTEQQVANLENELRDMPRLVCEVNAEMATAKKDGAQLRRLNERHEAENADLRDKIRSKDAELKKPEEKKELYFQINETKVEIVQMKAKLLRLNDAVKDKTNQKKQLEAEVAYLANQLEDARSYTWQTQSHIQTF